MDVIVPSGRVHVTHHFTVTQRGVTELIADMDLRRALTYAVGRNLIHFRPSIRVIDNTSYGTLVGTVQPELLALEGCDEGSMGAETGNVVHVYAADAADTGDIGSDNPPLVTARVTPDDNGNYSFMVAYLDPGDYMVMFTCRGELDNVDAAANGEDVDLRLVTPEGGNPVTIVDDRTTEVSFTTANVEQSSDSSPSGSTLEVSATMVSPGDAVTVTLSNGPGGISDWLALAEAADPLMNYSQWTSIPSGATAHSWTVNMPAMVGQYEFRLLLNNDFVLHATSPTVEVALPPGT